MTTDANVALVRQAIFTALDEREWDFTNDEQRVDFADRVVSFVPALPSSERFTTPILSTPTSPKGPLELTQGEVALHHPAPEREGEIAARESLEPEGHRLSGTVIEPGTVDAQNGLTAGRDPHPFAPPTKKRSAAVGCKYPNDCVDPRCDCPVPRGADYPTSPSTQRTSGERLPAATCAYGPWQCPNTDSCTATGCRALSAAPSRWIPVTESLPIGDTYVLVHNGKWTGVGRYSSDPHFRWEERWQDERSEFIECMGPKITHWRALPPAPSAVSAKTGSTG